MADLELVEKLRERANVTYDEAKEALQACDDDLLDAVIYLEKRGKVPPPSGGGGSFSSQEAEPEKPDYTARKAQHQQTHSSFSDTLRRFFDWIGALFQKGMSHVFEVTRDEKSILSLPVLVLIILVLCAFWVTVPLLIIGVFFGFRYTVHGPLDTNTEHINEIIDEVASVADSLKNEIKSNLDARESSVRDE